MISKNDIEMSLDIVGEIIDDVLCYKYHIINDVVLVFDKNNNCKVLYLSSIGKEVELYKIEGDNILKVEVTNNTKMFLFHTSKKQYLVNDQNSIVESSDQWSDSYFDVLANCFYRRDSHGYWYGIEGFRLQENVFLIDDVLTSLSTKTSKQSVSFKNQEIFISKNKQLIQVGKLVLNLNLEVVKYFGEKITGLGYKNIAFEGEDVLQEVCLGLGCSAFINEFTFEPFLFDNTKISNHLATYFFGDKRVVVFECENSSLGVMGYSNNFLMYRNKPLQIELDSHVKFNNCDLIKVNDGEKEFYYDLTHSCPLEISHVEKLDITNFDNDYVKVGNTRMFNVSNNTEQFVINEDNGSVFKLESNEVIPQRLEEIDKFKRYLGFAIVDGQRKLFSKNYLKIFRFGDEGIEVAEIDDSMNDRFINAIDTNGEKLVLDLRLGFDYIRLAEVEGSIISEYNGESIIIGNKNLLNVSVKKLGRNIKHVINVDEELISYFTFPKELKQVSDQDVSSVFAGDFICEIDMTSEIVIDDRSFISARFLAFTGLEYPVILDMKSGLPLFFEGHGHRDELAMEWVGVSLRNTYSLGSNRMVGVKTLSEDQRANELLFSVQKLSSLLPFYNSYLPVFKQVIEISNDVSETWNYHLFELRGISQEKEYVAVEKKYPFRILANRKGTVYQPRVLKSKEKSIKSPDKLTVIKRFFLADSRFLVEIE